MNELEKLFTERPGRLTGSKTRVVSWASIISRENEQNHNSAFGFICVRMDTKYDYCLVIRSEEKRITQKDMDDGS